MSVKATAHINLRGNAREALAFYQSVFGGQMQVITYKDMGHVQDPADADHVVWGQVAADKGFCVMAFDVPTGTPWNQGDNAFFVSVRGETAQEIAALWEKLAEGSTVLQPIAASAWSALYGMLKDRFGVVWVLDVAAQYSAG
ncbi:bleomycin resistance protein [Variovorax sp. KBW07]|uniref:VOC family protein n=1 Tax=Variovorax sp. KBW07 TaxID=2153358 RepID=UPI000F58888B|nr:VOC family protein [Variovorax sp. KBW07]RQO46260.1 bleomycin resistance protein [Variovorax sp. KBW07]